ncbi:MAG: site-specific integrase [Solirubrobacteraceae bacterium]
MCPITGRSRLSYERSAYLFKHSSLKVSKTGWTLHQLRHSALTHLAEAGVNLPLLMAKSGHENVRSLQKYARPSAEAVAAMTAAHDPSPPPSITAGRRERLPLRRSVLHSRKAAKSERPATWAGSAQLASSDLARKRCAPVARRRPVFGPRRSVRTLPRG